MNLLIIGNSHLIGFWDHWHTRFRETDGLNTSLIVTNFLKNSVSQSTASNQFEHKTDIDPRYLSRLHGDMCDVALPVGRKKKGNPIKLLLFGSAICGEATHGSICGGLLTAKFAYHADHQKYLGDQENLVGPVSNACLNAMYAHHYGLMVGLLKNWMSRPGLEVIGWVASPNITECSARMRFGDHIVDSGILRWHYEASWTQCVAQFSKHGLLDYILNPNEHKSAPNGALDDRYMFVAGDNHANGEFYQSHIEEIISRAGST